MLKNKNIVLQHLDLIWNKGEINNVKYLLSERFYYKTTFTDEILNTEQYIEFIEVLKNAIPDLSVDVELIMAENNLVMTQTSFVGEVVNSVYGIPASSKIITFPAVSVWEIKDQKIVSLDTLIDITGVSRQIGSVVSPQIPLNIR
jgi:steroid delta-isomerase-like uncharacterized protein